ncbi:MAG: urease accessory protein UreF [Chloroflexi bacterium]|nr:urease accessory protein UreF [Chloroflexota bacterium]
MANLVSLLQFADSLFPVGGQAHSFGLEYYVDTGLVVDAPGVQEVLISYLNGRAGPCDATAVAVAGRLAQQQDLEGCLELDRNVAAQNHVPESREASRQMGHQTARVAGALTNDPFIVAYLDAVESSETPGHHPVSFGLCGGIIGWDPEQASAAFLFSTASQIVGAATRLMPIGQLDAQQILWAVGPLIAKLAHETSDKNQGDIWSFSPGLEIAGMRHADLEQRLFRS